MSVYVCFQKLIIEYLLHEALCLLLLFTVHIHITLQTGEVLTLMFPSDPRRFYFLFIIKRTVYEHHDQFQTVFLYKLEPKR